MGSPRRFLHPRMTRLMSKALTPSRSSRTHRIALVPNLRRMSCQIPQSPQELIQRVERVGSLGFQRTAGHGVLIPEVLDDLNQFALLRVEVSVELLIYKVVELLQDERLRLSLSELAADTGQDGIRLVHARLQR